MSKIKEIKEAIKNTHPARLAKIEYQSHFLQILGVTTVCLILIWRGLWWIIFAFIFSLGISFSQGVSAYQKYKGIVEITNYKYDFKNDKSWTRKRDHVIKQGLGNSVPKIASSLFAVSLGILLVPYHTWYYKLLFTFSIILFYLIFYFYVTYWCARSVVDKEDFK